MEKFIRCINSPTTRYKSSFSNDRYEDKLEHYLRENTFAQTLHPNYYEKNPNFKRSEIIQDLEFKPHTQFKKGDIEERQRLVQRICERIWAVDYFSRTELE